MVKHSLSKLALSLTVALGTAGSALAATTIDFESTATGTYSSLGYGPVSISFLAGSGTFDVQNENPGPPVSDHVLISYFTNPGPGSFQATFSGGASSVSIGVNDYPSSDTDDVHLRAYDAVNVLLASDFKVIPGSGPGVTLTVSSATPIARVEWNQTGDYPGSVYWDNLTYAPVPEPGTYALMGMGLGLVALARRRKAV